MMSLNNLISFKSAELVNHDMRKHEVCLRNVKIFSLDTLIATGQDEGQKGTWMFLCL